MSSVIALPSPAVRFTLDEAIQAGDDWGFNCGPSALAAIGGFTIEEVRRYMGDFEQKGYTNPTLMFNALRSAGLRFENREFSQPVAFPKYGLCRVQWEGPWTKVGVPIAARYRHTHWIGAGMFDNWRLVFDVNAMSVGGWLRATEWATALVPWLLERCEPKADGKWHITHVIEVERPVRAMEEGASV